VNGIVRLKIVGSTVFFWKLFLRISQFFLWSFEIKIVNGPSLFSSPPGSHDLKISIKFHMLEIVLML